MSLPPVVMEIRANAAQFLSTQDKVIASAKNTATETAAAAQKASAASRTAAAEAVAATDKRIAAEARATEAAKKANQMQASSLGVMTEKQRAAYDAQVAGAQRAATAAELAGAKEAQAQMKATAAAEAYTTAQAKAAAAAKSSQTVMGQLTASAEKHSQAWSTAGTTLLGFGTAALLGVGVAIKSYADFDKQMSSVQAATHATATEMLQMRDAAITAGADTSFSAKEAAQGIEELSKAGVTTADVLSGGLAGSLSLAAAGALGVGESAELAATAMTQFKLGGEKIPHLADLLAAGAGKAQGSVQDLGMALKQGGLVAASTGLSIEETTGGLAAFASAGLLGSDAGTSFKTMLMALTPNSVAAASEMEKLGIHAYDAQGKFIGLSNFAGNLQDSMKGLSAESRNASMKIIFGSDAVRAANILYEQGAKGIDDWTAKVNDAGYAAETAAMKQDNLAGDVEKLGGSLDSVFLKSASGANEALRGLTKGAESLVDAIGQIPGPILQAVLGLTGIAGSAALAGAAFLTVFPKIMDAKKAYDQLKESNDKAAGALGAAGKAAGVAAGAFAIASAGLILIAANTEKAKTPMGEMTKAMYDFADSSKAAGKVQVDNIFSKWDKVFGNATSEVTGLDEAIKRFSNQDFNMAVNHSVDGLAGALGQAKSEAGQTEDKLKGIGDTLGEMVGAGNADMAAKSFERLANKFIESGKSTEFALDQMPAYKQALIDSAAAAGVQLQGQELVNYAMGKVPQGMLDAMVATKKYTDAAGSIKPIPPELQASLDEAGVSAEGLATDLEKVLDGMLASGLATLTTRDATTKFNQATEEARTAMAGLVKSNVDVSQALNATGTDFNLSSEAGQTLNGKFQDIMRSGINLAKSVTGTGVDAQKQVQSAMQGTYDSMIKAADGMGISGQKGIDLTRELLKIPPNVDIKTWIDEYAKGRAEALIGTLDKVPRHLTTFIDVQTNAQGAIADYANAVAQAKAAGKSLAYADGGLVAFADGGLIGGYPGGGLLTGPGTGTSDSMIARVSNGEFIVRQAAVAKYGVGFLSALNKGTLAPASGYIGATGSSSPTGMGAPSGSSSGSATHITNNVNVQTNATGADIAREIGWEMRTQ
ncbi:phage tail tape measure protein [Arthrobacter sp. ISL-69]|uniref:phage tail tape measure protein n=1 Tax=Arthrobacter sp. ISL-69 TaxID=2819113 RepID=UPI001BE8C807|nr:phage tail tape measure protein [Arthrobacter sp. ISL-69]MBT2537194.1 phage tail tape measure protein [Arthrobacter sp. ISL-69]